MMLKAATAQSQTAGQLVDTVLAQPQQAKIDLATKMTRVAMSMKLQAPAGTADASGVGGLVDLVG